MPSKAFGEELRINFLSFATYIYVCALVVRLFYIQVISHKEYENKAFYQHWNLRVLNAKRGDILSSDDYPLATSSISYLLFAEPKVLDNKDAAVSSLSAIINSGPDEDVDFPNVVKQKLTSDLYWVPITGGLSDEQKNAIEKLSLKGLGFEEEAKRYYPEQKLASHVLGFVAGSATGEERGYFGVEGYFNGDLTGKPGKILEERGAGGEVILTGGYKKIPSKNGRSVVLTLSREVQFLIEEKLKEGVEKYKAESGSVVIVHPPTGNIVAMANYPTFDPSVDKVVKESSESEKAQKKNLSITDTYEPGSIIKPLTLSAAMDLRLLDENTTFDDDGPKYYSGHRVDNWNGKHHGVQTIVQLLEKSNNIGAAWVGTRVGAKNLYGYFKKFGLGEPTGISLEGENTGILRNPEDWKDIDLATVSFGQGISTSVLQMAMAFSVFDNDGVLMKPRIVSRILEDKRVIDIPVQEKRRVVSKEIAERISKMLVLAVDNGEARYFNIRGYSVAGKTGTAQIPEEGKYDPNKTNATFIGFLPKAQADQKFVMVVKMERPTSSVYAAETAVPLWMDILSKLVVIYKIPPDRI
ncbi:penicillin-binding protein 2 [candidate division WWE3 bacterium]|nr:penicillin-binding protein 2 [candidate division WWE3 bacterium]